MLRTVIVVLATLAITAPAVARPATYRMTCAKAQALVARQGGVVMDTSRTTFDRYVANLRFCMPGQALKPEWVPARDVAQCFVGYTCIDPDRDWYRWGF
ncbi:hypothetical protein [Aquabacter spiritensis]|uniref:Uncharacterized protein n=1 Tax=Aquabacter spiritensis TaxID=933073 RepID=A0A4R3LQW2_9HYPH|nr:hypothetical protein [Aquabacter spiritensis]TCT02651.1 hypothetical protein EDC64_11286 [Aquabacter spiritensis]